LQHKSPGLARWQKRNEALIEFLGGVFWVVVVLGLATEFEGNYRAKKISDSENVRFSAEASRARMDAAKAVERAVNTESNNLVLRSNVAVLELDLAATTNSINKMDPRTQPLVSVKLNIYLKIQTKDGVRIQESLWGFGNASSTLYSDWKPWTGLYLGLDLEKANLTEIDRDGLKYTITLTPSPSFEPSWIRQRTFGRSAYAELQHIKGFICTVTGLHPTNAVVTDQNVILQFNGNLEKEFTFGPEEILGGAVWLRCVAKTNAEISVVGGP
jgi:hypothetical protein